MSLSDERLAALRWQAELFENYEMLPEICMSLRSGVNGSADEWEPDFIRQCLAMLRARLTTWSESFPREKAVDDAVNALVRATIAEVESYDWWQEKK